MKGIKPLSVESKILIELLRQKKPGEVATYAEMSAAIGQNVQEKRGFIHTARRHLQTQDRMIFRCEANVGLLRLNDAEIVKGADGSLREIRRKVSRSAGRISCADYDRLSPAEQLNYCTSISMLGLLTHVAQRATVKQVELQVQRSKREQPVMNILKSLTGE